MDPPAAAPPTTGATLRRVALLALAVAVVGPGCRNLVAVSPPALDDAVLPAVRAGDDGRATTAPPRTIPLEVLFVRHEPRDPAFNADLWRHVDEQALDADLRRRLEANGLRAGVVTGPLPADVADRLDPAAAMDPVEPGDTGLRRLLRLLPGRRADVVAAAGLAELVLLQRGADGVGGGTYRDASALVTLQAWPDVDGRIRLRLVPEVRHGEVRRSWVGEEGMFRLETGQERHAFDDLGITARLPVGGMLLVGTTEAEGAAVGDALLRDRDAAGGVRLLVVRPLAATADPMFATTGEATAADR